MAGGPEKQAFDALVHHPENFDVVDGRVYYSTAGAERGDKVIRVYDLGSGEHQEIGKLGPAPGKGLSVS